MPTFTVFCRESTGEGTTYVASDAADTWQAAARSVRKLCADDWDMDEEDIDVIGVAAGDVAIVAWDDEVNVLTEENATTTATTTAADNAPLPVIQTLEVESWKIHVSRGEDDGAMIVSIDSTEATGPQDHTKDNEPRLWIYVDDVARYDYTKND